MRGLLRESRHVSTTRDGGVEGDPEFSRDPKKALDLSHGREVTDKEFESCRFHLGYIHPQTPDAFLMRARRTELRNMATVYLVMGT